MSDSQVTCTRQIGFDAGHRVFGHQGRCRHYHGHRYLLEVVAHASGLNTLGMVIDFADIKRILGTWIDENWDHGFIVYAQDTELLSFLMGQKDSKYYVLPVNPTAENMAQFLLDHICPMLFKDTGICICEIKLWETPNCFATATKTCP